MPPIIVFGGNVFEELFTKLNQILKNQEEIMGANETVLERVDRLTRAFDGLKVDFQTLKDALDNQSAELSSEAQMALDTITAKFEAFDAEQPPTA
jgi:hypothetical protein